MTSPTTLQASLRAHLSPTAPPASSTLSRWTLSSLFLAETKPGARSSLPASWGEDRTAQRDPVERVERSGAEFGEGSSESAGEERSGTRNTLGGSGSTGKSFGSEGRNHDVDNHSSESVQNGHAVDSEAAEMIRHVKAILIEVKLRFPFLATKSISLISRRSTGSTPQRSSHATPTSLTVTNPRSHSGRPLETPSRASKPTRIDCNDTGILDHSPLVERRACSNYFALRLELFCAPTS